MANAGTLLSDLDGKQPIAGDSDLVSMIYQDMSNQDGRGGPPGGIQQSGMMPSMGPPQPTSRISMDPGPQTAHMIGGQHPTPADFAQMVQSNSAGFPSAGSSGWGPSGGSNNQAQLAAQIASIQQGQGKAWAGYIAEELKAPILIAILVFIVNLPFLSVLVAHYASWMLKPSGDMNLYGQLGKATLVGTLFWASNRILLPLLG